VCDFEDGSCNWQHLAGDHADWVRRSGASGPPHPDTAPPTDHTTYTAGGHYYWLPSSASDPSGHRAKVASPMFPAGRGACIQLWYYMHGEGVGTLNVYGPGGQETPLLSRTGTHGPMWRFAQASLGNHGQPYQVSPSVR
ncbi:hypothetical protein CRUP_033304, partial [Coryphaenoides rupestris]